MTIKKSEIVFQFWTEGSQYSDGIHKAYVTFYHLWAIDENNEPSFNQLFTVSFQSGEMPENWRDKEYLKASMIQPAGVQLDLEVGRDVQPVQDWYAPRWSMNARTMDLEDVMGAIRTVKRATDKARETYNLWHVHPQDDLARFLHEVQYCKFRQVFCNKRGKWIVCKAGEPLERYDIMQEMARRENLGITV